MSIVDGFASLLGAMWGVETAAIKVERAPATPAALSRRQRRARFALYKKAVRHGHKGIT